MEQDGGGVPTPIDRLNPGSCKLIAAAVKQYVINYKLLIAK